MLSLELRSSKFFFSSDLVKMSAVCWLVEMCTTRRNSCSIFSFMNCQSISTLFLRLWWIGFLAMLMADRLSQYSFIGVEFSTLSSFRIGSSQILSHTPTLISPNLAYVLLLATMDCFVPRKVTKFSILMSSTQILTPISYWPCPISVYKYFHIPPRVFLKV